jgi:hypothetical protein
MLAVLALALPMIFLSSKGPRGGTILLIVGELVSLLWLFYGMWQLHRTLNPKVEKRQTLKAATQRAFAATQTAALPPQSAHASVTEGTTERLVTPERELVERRR